MAKSREEMQLLRVVDVDDGMTLLYIIAPKSCRVREIADKVKACGIEDLIIEANGEDAMTASCEGEIIEEVARRFRRKPTTFPDLPKGWADAAHHVEALLRESGKEIGPDDEPGSIVIASNDVDALRLLIAVARRAAANCL